MMKDIAKAMKLFILAHVGLTIIYYFLYTFLTLDEKASSEVSKTMLIAFTAVNVIVYFISNGINQEKTKEKQMKSECYLYALILSEVIMGFIAYFMLGK